MNLSKFILTVSFLFGGLALAAPVAVGDGVIIEPIEPIEEIVSNK